MNAGGSFVERARFSCDQEINSFIVRKGHVWIKLQNNSLCYASPSQPFSCVPLPTLGYSYLEVVSEQGNHCFAILTVGPTVLEAVAGQVHRISLPNFPGTRDKVGTWLTTSMSNKPILFIAHKAGKCFNFGYYDLGESVLDLHRIEDMEIEGRVIMLRVQLFDNQIHLFLLVSRDSQLIYVRRKLNRDMTAQSYQSEVPMQNLSYFGGDTHLAFVDEKTIRLFRFDGYSQGQFVIPNDLDTEPVSFIAMLKDILFVFRKTVVKVYVEIRQRHERKVEYSLVDEIPCEPTTLFGLDGATGDIYGARDDKFFALKLPSRYNTTESLDMKYRLYKILAERGDFRAADILARFQELPFTEKWAIARQNSPSFRLEFLECISDVKPTCEKGFVLMKLNLYSRIEADRGTTTIEKLPRWITDALDGQILTPENIIQTFETYGLECPGMKSRAEATFDALLACQMRSPKSGQKIRARAIGLLPAISTAEDFIVDAASVYKIDPGRVAGYVRARSDWLVASLVRHLPNDKSRLIETVYSNWQRSVPWIKWLFFVWLSQTPEQKEPTIAELVRENEDDPVVQEAIIRAFLSVKRYSEVGMGLYAMGRVHEAVKFAVMGDPLVAARLIMRESDRHARVEYFSLMFSRLGPEKAGEIVKVLGPDVDLATAIRFAGPSTTIRDLAITFDTYLLEKRVGANYDEQKDNALEGMRNLREYEESQEKKELLVSGNSECSFCRHSLFASEWIAYPCGHGVHRSCLEHSGATKEKLELGCPLCGMLAVALIPMPFIPVSDPWSLS